MSLSSYYRQYDKQNLAELERQKEALRQMSETQKQLVNENADASIKQIEETGNANIREAEHAYDGVVNTANVQKLINERQVAERMANLGMTDSGLNRTQQTAVQLSHSNSVNRAMVARQKQIDALALAINQQIGQVNIQRHTDLTNLDLAHQQNLYGLDEQYRANRDSWASSAYDADQARAAKEYQAYLDYQNGLIEEANKQAQELSKEATEARAKLLGQLYDENISEEQKIAYATNYVNTYGSDPTIDAALKSGIIKGYGDYGNTWSPAPPSDENAETIGKYVGATTNVASKFANTAGTLNDRIQKTIDQIKAETEEAKTKKSTQSTAIPRATGESDEMYAARVAESTLLSTSVGKEFAKLYGTPETTTKTPKQLGKIIIELYQKGEISEGVAKTLINMYGAEMPD